MNMSLHRETAKIYQFPAGGRTAVTGGRVQKQTPEAISTARPAKIAYGASWYHEAAIEEDDQSFKR